MRKVYIISRYRGATEREREFNRNVARYFCRQVALNGDIPIAPHLFYTQFLNDDIPEERGIGTGAGIAELLGADEFLLVLIDGWISEGMRRELIEISRRGKTGRFISMTKGQFKKALKAAEWTSLI